VTPGCHNDNGVSLVDTGLSREEKEIAYRDISELTEATISGQRFLYIMHPGGEFTIAASMLPSKAAFAEVCELLARRIRESRLAE
jgi:histidinol phosphatase-like PHP family hydrolase